LVLTRCDGAAIDDSLREDSLVRLLNHLILPQEHSNTARSDVY